MRKYTATPCPCKKLRVKKRQTKHAAGVFDTLAKAALAVGSAKAAYKGAKYVGSKAANMGSRVANAAKSVFTNNSYYKTAHDKVKGIPTAPVNNMSQTKIQPGVPIPIRAKDNIVKRIALKARKLIMPTKMEKTASKLGMELQPMKKHTSDLPSKIAKSSTDALERMKNNNVGKAAQTYGDDIFYDAEGITRGGSRIHKLIAAKRQYRRRFMY